MTDDNTSPRPERAIKPANKRGAARLGAVQALYQMDVGGSVLADVLAEFEAFRLGSELDGEQYREADPAWFRDLVKGVVAEQRRLDPEIHRALVASWPLKRIDTTLARHPACRCLRTDVREHRSGACRHQRVYRRRAGLL